MFYYLRLYFSHCAPPSHSSYICYRCLAEAALNELSLQDTKLRVFLRKQLASGMYCLHQDEISPRFDITSFSSCSSYN